MSDAVLELTGVSKAYGGLRPLRIDRLRLAAGERVALVGLDQASAEVLVNLVTGATLPDAGDVSILGRSTAAILDAADWLGTVDRFGIVSERAVLLDQMSVVQNLAIPFSLDIEPPPDDVRRLAVAAGREVGLDDGDWDRRVADGDGTLRLRVRLARALALDPAVVLFEHPTAHVERSEAAGVGQAMRAVLDRRGVAALALTADRPFADAFASRVLTLDPATGRLAGGRGWPRWWS